jgi:hypothetical protein
MEPTVDARERSRGPAHAAGVGPSRRPFLLRLLVVAGVVAACGAEPLPPPGAAVVRDSAGVQIIESTGFLPGGDALPTLVAGSLVAEMGPHFLGGEQDVGGILGGSFEPSGALLLASGRRPLLRRWAASEGRLEGLGLEPPPEFQEERIRFLHPTQGGFLLWDSEDARAGTLSWRGGLSWEAPVALPAGGELVGRLSRRTWVISTTLPPDPGTGGPESLALHLQPARGGEGVALGSWPGRSFLTLKGETHRKPFTAPPPVAVIGEQVFVAGREGDVQVLDARGGHLRTLRTGVAGRPVTRAEREAFLREGLSALGERGRPLLDALLEAVEEGARIPAFDRILGGPAGRIWLRHTLTDSYAEQEWTVVEPEGHVAFRARMPPGFEVLAVQEDQVAGSASHPLGFTVLRVHELIELATPPPSPPR